ncbi:MAG: hypothetical protein ACKVQR_21815 [Aquabacterium sp.]
MLTTATVSLPARPSTVRRTVLLAVAALSLLAGPPAQAQDAGPAVAAIERELALLHPDRTNLRETTRSLKGGAPGTETLVSAYRDGPDIRRVVVSVRNGPQQLESRFTWVGARVVHAHVQQLQVSPAQTRVMADERLWFDKGRLLQWQRDRALVPVRDAAAAPRAAQLLAQADAMRRLMMTALPRGRDRCDWVCVGGGTACRSFRCE